MKLRLEPLQVFITGNKSSKTGAKLYGYAEEKRMAAKFGQYLNILKNISSKVCVCVLARARMRVHAHTYTQGTGTQ